MELAILIVSSLNLVIMGYFLVYPQIMTFIKLGKNKKSLELEKNNSKNEISKIVTDKKNPPIKLNNEMGGHVVNPKKKITVEPKKPKTVKDVVKKIEESEKPKKFESKEM